MAYCRSTSVGHGGGGFPERRSARREPRSLSPGKDYLRSVLDPPELLAFRPTPVAQQHQAKFACFAAVPRRPAICARVIAHHWLSMATNGVGGPKCPLAPKSCSSGWTNRALEGLAGRAAGRRAGGAKQRRVRRPRGARPFESSEWGAEVLYAR